MFSTFCFFLTITTTPPLSPPRGGFASYPYVEQEPCVDVMWMSAPLTMTKKETSKPANTRARVRSRAASNAKHGARDEEERKLANLEIYIENLFFFPSRYGKESRKTRRKEREIRKGKKRRKKHEAITVFLLISNCFFF